MKFQTILLFATAASFVFANGLEVSDNEDLVDATSAESLPADMPVLTADNNDAGISSEIDDTNELPMDGVDNTPVDEPVDAADNTPVDEPVDAADNTPVDEPVDAADNIPVDEPVDAADNTPVEVGDSNPADIDAGEGSDDYGVSNTGANVDSFDGIDAADVAAADAENSDDYGDNAEVPTDGAEITKVDDLDAEDSAAEEDGASDSTLAAAGIAGAAALSSAGIFLWIKKSKKFSLENSPLNMA